MRSYLVEGKDAETTEASGKGDDLGVGWNGAGRLFAGQPTLAEHRARPPTLASFPRPTEKRTRTPFLSFVSLPLLSFSDQKFLLLFIYTTLPASTNVA
jgi:hypothetical protein